MALSPSSSMARYERNCDRSNSDRAIKVDFSEIDDGKSYIISEDP